MKKKKFQYHSPLQFLEVHGCPKSLQNFYNFSPMFWDRSSGPFPAFSISIYILMHNFNTRSPLIFLGSHGLSQVSKEFSIIRSHVLGPINNPFPAFNAKILELKTQTAPKFLGSHGHLQKSQRISNNSVPSFGTDQTAPHGLKLTETSKNP